ncbi:MAG: DNA repair exonuclease [Chloroflexi bacterium]|jgi:DNA repair exonuclease SbcCD nuclease subunit|nr:DNA repair exonuclease [Chloroflexota bacterium]
MLRLVHTADVHLGARHADLGDQAAALRERQFAAFAAAVELALAEKVDAFLVAGDLFDSNTQPRRSVERAAAELGRLVAGHVRVALIPGTHDVFDRASVYRAYDLAAMAGAKPGTDRLVVLTPDRPEVTWASLDLTVHGRVFATKRAPVDPLAGFDVSGDRRTTWHVAMVHGSVRIAGMTENDEVVVAPEAIAASGLDYLALGHWHSTRRGQAGATVWAYPGAPEPVAMDQAGAGSALLVTFEEREGRRGVVVEERRIGRTKVERLDIDAADVASQPALVGRLAAMADSDLVLDVRLTGLRPDALDLVADEVERELAPRFFRLRVRDASVAALPEGPLPPADTIAGALARDLAERIADAEAAGDPDAAADLREALRLGRLLLDGREVTL